MKIAVIGGGNGAFAVAGDMSLAGHTINLYENKRFEGNIKELMESKEITVTGVGRTGKASINCVTTDLGEAIDGVDLIMPVVPAYALDSFANDISEYIKSGDKIVLAPGSTGGALIVAKVLKEKGKIDGVKIAEMHTLPYACRKQGGDSVKILLEVRKLYFAAFPNKYNDEMYKLTSELYPAIELVDDVLQSSLNNGNPISHPAPVVLNAGKIEYSKGEHYHYREGITPSVARVNEKIDIERQRICEAFGYSTVNAKERLFLMGYVPKRDTLYESYRDSEAFSPLKGPKDLNDRYLTEDTPCSLVALSSLANVVSVSTPIMDSIITIASALKDEDYWDSGNTVNTLGLNEMNKEEIMMFLKTGY